MTMAEFSHLLSKQATLFRLNTDGKEGLCLQSHCVTCEYRKLTKKLGPLHRLIGKMTQTMFHQYIAFLLLLLLSKCGSVNSNAASNQNMAKDFDRDMESMGCLQCLCVGSTNCMQDLDCADGYCGPFQLCEEYWVDAGMPGGDFQQCAVNYTCAQKTVIRYMNRFGDDCDGDQMVTCDDYAKIHFQGRHRCTEMQHSHEWHRYAKCREILRAM